MNKDNGLKQIQTLLTSLEKEVEALKSELTIKNQELNLKNKSIKDLKKRIESLSEKELIISEHALLRYCERVLNIDLEEAKTAIISEEIKTMMNTLGKSGTFPNKKGFSIVVKNNVVTTILI